MESPTTFRASRKSILVPLVITLLFGAYLSYVSASYPSNTSASNCASQTSLPNTISQNNPVSSIATVFQIPQPGNATFCVLYHVSSASANGTERLQPNYGPAGPPLMPNGYAACGYKISPNIDGDCIGLSASISPPVVNYYGNETFSAEITINATGNSTPGTYMLLLPGTCGEGLVIYFIVGSTLQSSVIPVPVSLCPNAGQIFNATASVVSYQGALAIQMPLS